MSLKRMENAIRNMPLPLQQKIAEEWLAELKATGKSERTLICYAGVLNQLAQKHEKPFKRLTKADLVKFLGSYANQNTKNLAGFVCKAFLKWLYGMEEPPDVIRWWKPKQDRKTLLPESLLTQNEIKEMLAKTPSIRDRCFLSVLYDSGARVGEIIPLCRESVSFTEQGAVIIISGKTGRRRLLLVNSAPILRDVLNSIPNLPKVNLWTGQMEKQIDDSTARLIAKKAGQRINKDVHPHLLRHSRASHLALKMSETGMRARFGWTPGSDMTKRYIHLSGKELDNEFLEAEGVKLSEHAEEKSGLVPISCPVCKLPNDPTYSYCAKCAAPLLPGMESDLEKFSEQISRLLNDPILDAMVEKWHTTETVNSFVDMRPHLEQEAQFARLVCLMGERQAMLARALTGLKPLVKQKRKMVEEFGEPVKTELAWNMRRARKRPQPSP